MKIQLSRYAQKLIFFLIISAVLITSLFVFLAFQTVFRHYQPSPLVENTVSVKKIVKPGLPKQLMIPSINVNIDIDYVGLTTDDAMDIRPNSKLATWYMLGPRPGDKGSAVIAGHYGWGENGEPAIFNDIHKLKKGDEVSVIDQKGQSITFVVREIREYIPESDATVVFKSNDDMAHLNLITCNGVWVDGKQSYSNRLVVFADIK